MPFDLELTISGLVVLAVKSSESRPATSTQVDVICPDAHGHRPRLSFNPLDLHRAVGILPDLDIDATGERIAALDLRSRSLAFTIGTEGNQYETCTMQWRSEEAETPSSKKEEVLMDWLPRLASLGFDGFVMPSAGRLPAGASARITLPPGDIECANVLKNPDTKRYFRYVFPAAPSSLTRAVANDIVFRAYGLESLVVKDNEGRDVLSTTALERGDVLRICISNDLDVVGRSYGSNDPDLDHLKHLSALVALHGGQPFKAPKPIDDEGGRTGDPICDGAFFVYNEDN
jgi:hypothetical protein